MLIDESNEELLDRIEAAANVLLSRTPKEQLIEVYEQVVEVIDQAFEEAVEAAP